MHDQTWLQNSWQGPGFCWNHGYFSHPAFYVFSVFLTLQTEWFSMYVVFNFFLNVECLVVGRYWCNVVADKKSLNGRWLLWKKIFPEENILHFFNRLFKTNYYILAKMVLPSFHWKKWEREAGDHFCLGTFCFVISQGNRFVWEFCDLFLNFCFQVGRKRQRERQVLL